MKNRIVVAAMLMGGFSLSCSQSKTDKKTGEVEYHEAHNHEKHQEHSVEEVKGLELNNGEKWVANAETHEGMVKIKEIIEASKPVTLEEFHKMGIDCDGQTSYIINNCSMTGESHNQLHFVLHPILDNIDGLSNATSIEEGIKAYNSLNKNISDYFKFFKVQ